MNPARDRVRSFVPMAQVKSVTASIAFYERLGFVVKNTFTPQGAGAPAWASLESDRANLMLSAAEGSGFAGAPTVLFYAYCDDVAAMRARLLSEGVRAGEIQTPFYAPRGEFQIEDPDGYVVMVTHT